MMDTNRLTHLSSLESLDDTRVETPRRWSYFGWTDEVAIDRWTNEGGALRCSRIPSEDTGAEMSSVRSCSSVDRDDAEVFWSNA
jgi:hypothetical protein